MCCDSSGFEKDEIDGECPDCEEPTVDGEAYESCGYATVMCETCGWSVCDGGC